MKTKTIVGWLAILSLAYCLYISFEVNPDITFTKWFGYKFGLNVSENIPFKLLTISLLFAYGYLATIRSDDSAETK
jgi:hypothetical protein